jgi:hypothetical protein
MRGEAVGLLDREGRVRQGSPSRGGAQELNNYSQPVRFAKKNPVLAPVILGDDVVGLKHGTRNAFEPLENRTAQGIERNMV